MDLFGESLFAGRTDPPMQIVDLVESTPPMVHRNQMLDGCTVDDEMWYHALVTMARLESEVRPDLQNQRPEEWVLYQLICRGVIDQDDNQDKVFRLATRAMRYLSGHSTRATNAYAGLPESN